MTATDSEQAAQDAERAAAAVNGAQEAPDAGGFTLELNQDQKDIREWVHGFAEQSR